MRKSIYVICLVIIITLSSCSSYEKLEDTNNSNEEAEGITLEMTESTLPPSSAEISTEWSSFDSSEQPNEKLDAYNELPLYVKVQLIAEVVDHRAYPEGNKSLKERGYVIGYYIDENFLILQVGSGVGVGHPLYLLDYNDEVIMPREGVVRVSAFEYKIISDVDSSSVSKELLYDHYLDNKEAYNSSQEEVTEREDMIEYFEFQKAEALKQLN